MKNIIIIVLSELTKMLTNYNKLQNTIKTITKYIKNELQEMSHLFHPLLYYIYLRTYTFVSYWS